MKAGGGRGAKGREGKGRKGNGKEREWKGKGEEGKKVLRNSPSKTKTIIGRSTTTKFIDNKKGIGSSSFNNRSSFQHFSHESGNTTRLGVTSTNTTEDSINNGNRSRLSGNKASNLGHKDNDAHRTDESRLSAHIGAGNDVERGLIAHKRAIVGNVIDGFLQFEAGMSSLLDDNVSFPYSRDFWTHVVFVFKYLCQARV